MKKFTHAFYRLFNFAPSASLSACFCLLPFALSAQAPQGINYQAVARDASGSPLANTTVNIKFSVYNSSPLDTVWIETHNKVTNQFGLFTAVIGQGTKIGGSAISFSNIKWGTGTYYLRVFINGNDMGSTQFLAVPYAMFADSAGTAPGMLPSGTSGQTLRHDGTGWVPNSLLYNDGTNIGIGTTAPGGKLDIESGTPLFLRLSRTNNNISQHLVFSPSGPFSPSNVQWYLGRDLNENHFRVLTWDGSSSITRLFIEDNGKIGVGTSNPSSKLHISASSPFDGINIVNPNRPYIGLNHTGTGNAGGIAFQQNGATKMEMFYNIPGNKIHFYDNASATTRVVFQGDGKVGIGTEMPSSRLHVVAPGSSGLIINATDQINVALPVHIEANTTGKIFGSDTWGRIMRLEDSRSGAGFYDVGINNSGFLFISKKNTNPDASGTALTIDNTGNIGIGTTAPSEKLDVVGNIKFSGALMPNNSPGTSGQVLTSAGAGNPPVWGNLPPITGSSGASNYVPKWDVSGFGLQNSQIYDDGTNINISGDNSDGAYKFTIGKNASSVENVIALTNTNNIDGAGTAIAFRNKFTSTLWDQARIYGVTTDGSAKGALVFQTMQNRPTNNLIEAMRITGDGNVGIGTMTPSENLQVQRSANSMDNATVSVVSGNTGKAILYLGKSSHPYMSAIRYDNSTNTLDFWTNNTPDRLKIDGSGNVTIPALVGPGAIAADAFGNLSVKVNGAPSGGLPNGTYGSTLHFTTLWQATSNLYNNGSNVGIGTTSPNSTALLHIDVGSSTTQGILVTGTYTTTATIPNLGAGSRMMYYPGKAAFRAGRVTGTQWDNANVGFYSFAAGDNNMAIGNGSVALGVANTVTVSGNSGIALGANNFVSNISAVAIGDLNTASGNTSFSAGLSNTSGGSQSVTLGRHNIANGIASVAMGNRTHDNSFQGCFLFGDNSTTSNLNATTNNQFLVRAAGGIRMFTDAGMSIGVQVLAGGNSWGSISDSTKKENFISTDGEYVLASIRKMKMGSWNYKTQDPRFFRHYGPMAQEFFYYFGDDGKGFIGNDTTIACADFSGINMIAIKALEQRTTSLNLSYDLLDERKADKSELEKVRAENNLLKQQLEKVMTENILLKAEVEKIKSHLGFEINAEVQKKK